MILKIKCPCCDQDLSINIEDDQIISVEMDGTIHLSDGEVKRVLNDINVELGM